jgi:hypothetical protein
MKTRTTISTHYFVLLLGVLLLSSQTARADIVTFTGRLTSDGSAVGSGDPVITDPTTINAGDPFSILLTYNPASFTHSGSSYVLTDASLTLQFDGYSFAYKSAAGDYIEFSTPVVFGPLPCRFSSVLRLPVAAPAIS